MMPVTPAAALDALLANASDGVVVIDAAGRLIDVNPLYCDLVGRSRSELLGMVMSDLDAQQSPAGIVGRIERAAAKGRDRFDTLHRRSDGHLIDVEVSVTVLDRPCTRLLCFVRDTSARRRAEQKLHDSRDMLQALTEAQADFLVRGDPRDAFNQLLEHVLRLTDSAYGFIGEVFPDADGRPYLKAHAITNISWNDETRRLYEDSARTGLTFKKLETLYGRVLTSGRPLISNQPAGDPRKGGLPPGHPSLDAFLGLPLDRGGELVGMVGVANRKGGYDEELITRLQPFVATCAALIEAHRNERRRQATDEALAEARARLVSALDAGGIATWTADARCTSIDCDDRAARMLGHTADPPGALTVDALLQLAHPEDRPSLVRAMEQARINGVLDAEFRVGKVDADVGGSGSWIAIKGRLRGDPGTGRLVGAFVNTTLRRQLEEQLRQAQKMEAIGQLAGGVAHDFNNLLTIIHGNAVALQGVLQPDGGDMAESADQIVWAADSAAALTGQLLTFSRRQAMRLRTVDLNDVVRSTARMIQHIIGERVQLVLDLTAGLPAITADARMLEQVLLNLAVNARDAIVGRGRWVLRTEVGTMPPGADAMGIDARAVDAPLLGGGPSVRLVARDTGTGIAPEHLPRLFEPFFTTKEVGRGTGLGLATVYGIVKQHRGWIAAESTPGEGAVFRIDLPALPEAGAEPLAPGRSSGNLVGGTG